MNRKALFSQRSFLKVNFQGICASVLRTSFTTFYKINSTKKSPFGQHSFFILYYSFSSGAHASYYSARNYIPVKSMQFLPSRKQGAPRRARHFLADKTCEFSPENSWVKIAWIQFLPAFRTSAPAPFFHSLAPLPPSRTPPAVLQSGLGSICKSPKKGHGSPLGLELC